MFGSYDISFCSFKYCNDTKCRRNQKRLENYPYPVSIMDFPKCENWVNGSHAIDERFSKYGTMKLSKQKRSEELLK